MRQAQTAQRDECTARLHSSRTTNRQMALTDPSWAELRVTRMSLALQGGQRSLEAGLKGVIPLRHWPISEGAGPSVDDLMTCEKVGLESARKF